MGFGRTLLLFAAFTALFVAIGWLLGGTFLGDPATGMGLLLLVALG